MRRGDTVSILSDRETAIRNFGAVIVREAKAQTDRLAAVPADAIIDAAIGLPAGLAEEAAACLSAVQEVLEAAIGTGDAADEVYEAYAAARLPQRDRLMSAVVARGLKFDSDLRMRAGAISLGVIATPAILAECPPELRARCVAAITLLPKF
jgi:hypothetical protein